MDAERPFVIEGDTVTFNKYVDHDFDPFIDELEAAYERAGELTFDFSGTGVLLARWMRALEEFRLHHPRCHIEGVADDLIESAGVIGCDVFEPSGQQQIDDLDEDDDIESLIVRAVLSNLWQRRPFKWEFSAMQAESPEGWVEMIQEMRSDVAEVLSGGLRLGVAAVLWRNDQVLMLQRSGSHGADTWAFPGGHVDHGEVPRVTVAREVLEETGLALGPGSFVPETFTADIFEAKDKKYITLYFRANVPLGLKPEIKEPEKCSDMKWVTPGQWPGELFLPIRNLLKQPDGARVLKL